MTADASIEERVASAGKVGAMFAVGLAIGPYIAGLTWELSPSLPFWTSAALYALASAMALGAFQETLVQGNRVTFSLQRGHPFGGMVLLLSKPKSRILFACYVLTFSAIVGTVVLAPLVHGARLQWGADEIENWQTVVWSAVGVGNIALLPVLLKYMSMRSVFVLSLVSCSVCTLLNAFASSSPLAFLVAATYVPTFLYDSACRALVGELFPQSVGLAQSGITSLACLLQMICPILYSVLYAGVAGTDLAWSFFAVGSVFPLLAVGLTHFRMEDWDADQEGTAGLVGLEGSGSATPWSHNPMDGHGATHPADL